MIRSDNDTGYVLLTARPYGGLVGVLRGVAPFVAQKELPVALMPGADYTVNPSHPTPINDVGRSTRTRRFDRCKLGCHLRLLATVEGSTMCSWVL